jgi:hypothetical protein
VPVSIRLIGDRPLEIGDVGLLTDPASDAPGDGSRR